MRRCTQFNEQDNKYQLLLKDSQIYFDGGVHSEAPFNYHIDLLSQNSPYFTSRQKLRNYADRK